MASGGSIVAEDLARHIADAGGSIAPTLHSFYLQHPDHKAYIKACPGNLRTFCDAHKEYLRWEHGSTPADHRIHLAASGAAAAIALAQFVLRSGGSAEKLAQFYKDFPSFQQYVKARLREFCDEHSSVLQYHALSNSVQLPKAKAKAKSKAKAKAKANPQVEREPKSDAKPASSSSTPSEPAEAEVARHLEEFVRQRGGCVVANRLHPYYMTRPDHKAVIGGHVRAFCDRHSGLLRFEPISGTPGFILAAAGKRLSEISCKYFAKGNCVNGSRCVFRHDDSGDHHNAGRGPDGPTTTRSQCDDAASSSSGSDASSTCSEFDLEEDTGASPPSQESVLALGIKWAHASIKIRFKTGKLLVETLRELLDQKLSPASLPKFHVLHAEGQWHAITGNRRLWVLREYARMKDPTLTIAVKRLNPIRVNSSWVKKTMTTRNAGESVEFVTMHRSKDIYPSMMFALAAALPSCGEPPDAADMKLGRVLHVAAAELDISAFASKVGWGAPPLSSKGDIREYIVQRQHLFRLRANSVSLADVRDILFSSQIQHGTESEKQLLSRPGSSSPCDDARVLDATPQATSAKGRIDWSECDPWQQDGDPWQAFGSNSKVGVGRRSRASSQAKATSPAADAAATIRPSQALEGSIARQPQDASILLGMIPDRLVSEDMLASGGFFPPLQKVILDVGSRPRAFYCSRAEVSGTRWIYLSSDPAVTCSPDDMARIVERAGGDPGCESVVLPRTIHRMRLLRSTDGGVVGVTIRIGHAIHGACGLMSDILGRSDDSVLVAGLTDSGKTTILREAARLLSERRDVMVIDCTGELQSSGVVRHLRFAKYEGHLDTIIGLLREHAVEVLVADDLGVGIAWELGEACKAAGVRLIGSVCSTFCELVKTWYLPKQGEPHSSDQCGRSRSGDMKVPRSQDRCPLDVVVETSRSDLNAWHVVLDVAAAVDSALAGVAPACQLRSRDPATGEAFSTESSLRVRSLAPTRP